MRVLLDECVDVRLKRHLTGHQVETVSRAGWSGKRNGVLLGLASERFDVLLTVDQNMQYQQNLGQAKIAVIVVRVRGNNLAKLLPVVPEILQAIENAKQGDLILVGSAR